MSVPCTYCRRLVQPPTILLQFPFCFCLLFLQPLEQLSQRYVRHPVKTTFGWCQWLPWDCKMCLFHVLLLFQNSYHHHQVPFSVSSVRSGALPVFPEGVCFPPAVVGSDLSRYYLDRQKKPFYNSNVTYY